ncbi:AzlC family ABC transporter permease [Pseudomonas sp. COR18]|uniref:AzlC family ABC transporter permease n=1 Tax=Pseudomonas sp. COR18 TaxID=3399680 RepID=UPI003B006B62
MANQASITDSPGEQRRASRNSFTEGCIDSLPVCLTFMFLFFSIGAASRDAGFMGLQALIMTFTVHAAPLQVFLAQHGANLTVMSILFTTLVVNFRFLIMSSVLTEHFKGVPLWKSLLSAQLLSISTFTLSNAKKGMIANVYNYYLGCGISTLSIAIVATGLGYWVSGDQNPLLQSVIGVILPIHFTVLASLAWPKLKPMIATGAGFALTPIVGRYLHDYQIFVVPFALGAALLIWDELFERKSQ